ncbi:MAG: hypothetical protein KAS66_16190 [Candidatus Omnitrophica bacterium]|nr:hypothetical protein [Candidatus Omnitrophota bacterium]
MTDKNNIDSNERCFNAYLIPKVEAKRHNGIDYVRCPFCESLNRMTDDLRGLHICGDCHVPFDVI